MLPKKKPMKPALSAVIISLSLNSGALDGFMAVAVIQIVNTHAHLQKQKLIKKRQKPHKPLLKEENARNVRQIL